MSPLGVVIFTFTSAIYNIHLDIALRTRKSFLSLHNNRCLLVSTATGGLKKKVEKRCF